MQYDVFISYAHNDNVASEGKYGWVDSFHIALYQYLTGKLGLGRKAKIWRDRTGLGGNALLNEALANGVNNSLIFIPILSPNFLASKYCAQELQTFLKQPNVVQGHETRLFPVAKLPIGAPPAPIDGSLIKFMFFSEDDFGELSEIDPSFGDEFRNKFNQKVNDLAREIAAFIGRNLPLPPVIQPVVVNARVSGGQVKSPAIQNDPAACVPKIYLAEPSPDLFDKYLEIKRDLEERREHGALKFEFLPQPLPEDPIQIAEKPDEAEDYKKFVRNEAKDCRLSIHLIGKKHNNAPFGSNQSYLELAMNTAAERDGEPNFNRLVWIPKNIFPEEEMQAGGSERHKAFVAGIRQNGVSGDGLMQDSFEKFKSRIIEMIENKPKVLLPLPPNESWFYVLCDKSDLETVRKVEDLLQNNKYAIFSSADYLEDALGGESDVNVFETHNEYLTRCNAVLIFWDKARIPWVRKNVFDLQGSAALRKGQAIDFQAVILDGDLKDEDKIRFRTPPPRNCYKINYEDFSTILSQANTTVKD
jgi:hypothetical protein